MKSNYYQSSNNNTRFLYLSITLTCLLAVNDKLFCQNATVNSKSISFFNNSIVGTEGQQHQLLPFKRKKIWLLVLPDSLTKKDTSLFKRIDSIANAIFPTVQTIVIPAQGKKGFISDGGTSLTKWYETMRNHHILFSRPMAVKKGKQSAQSDDILKWLTDAKLNGHFDKQINASGSIYLINVAGELKGVFDFGIIWNLDLLHMIFQ